jgi:hypothetical protein
MWWCPHELVSGPDILFPWLELKLRGRERERERERNCSNLLVMILLAQPMTMSNFFFSNKAVALSFIKTESIRTTT